LETAALRRVRRAPVGEPDDVTSLVAFLLTDEDAWINSQVINVDGGTVLR
jgi:3-oxoacyl-[acyl-carrier protein] reductase